MGRFKYTYGGGFLTEEQRQFYEDNGYIVIRNNVSHDLLDEFRQRFVDICEGIVDPRSMLVIKDASLKGKGAKGEYLINKIQDWLYDEVFFKYPTHKNIVDVLTDIIGPNITAFHSMIINKPPDAHPGTSRHPMHQDMFYFPFAPPERVVASWTAMEKIDESNGGLYVVPGTHKGEIYRHDYPQDYKNKLYYGVQGMDHLPKLHVAMEKGDTIFFHPVLLHGSGPNCTKRFRKAITCHYADSNCDFVDLKGTFRERSVLELEDLMRERGLTFKFENFWKSKSRLVAGVPGNFQRLSSNL